MNVGGGGGVGVDAPFVFRFSIKSTGYPLSGLLTELRSGHFKIEEAP
jgi:hypothetical protein